MMKTRTKHQFTSAKKMFEALLAIGIPKNDDEAFVYRGLSDASYQLIPSFMRDTSGVQNIGLESDAMGMLPDSAPYRIFYQTANQLGYSLPSVSAAKHANLVNTRSIDALIEFTDRVDEPNYDDDDCEIMSFAQHYGIPTPLLDWSRSPLVALYFAASGALGSMADFASEQAKENSPYTRKNHHQITGTIHEKFKQTYISVWRADTNAITELGRNRKLWDEDSEIGHEIRFFTPRSQGNDNIVAQQGLFSIHHPFPMTFDYICGEGKKTCLSEAVNDDLAWSEKRQNNSNYITEVIKDGPMHIFILPYREVYSLMAILNRCGINAATVFPGHNGCAERVRERAALALIAPTDS